MSFYIITPKYQVCTSTRRWLHRSYPLRTRCYPTFAWSTASSPLRWIFSPCPKPRPRHAVRAIPPSLSRNNTLSDNKRYQDRGQLMLNENWGSNKWTHNCYRFTPLPFAIQQLRTRNTANPTRLGMVRPNRGQNGQSLWPNRAVWHLVTEWLNIDQFLTAFVIEV